MGTQAYFRSFHSSSEPEGAVITSLDAAFTENEADEIAVASDSDGYLSEVLDCIRFVFYRFIQFYVIASQWLCVLYI